MDIRCQVLRILECIDSSDSMLFDSVVACIPVLSSVRIWFNIYGCTQMHLKPSVEGCGKVFSMEFSLHGNVNILLEVTQPCSPYMTARQPLPLILDSTVTSSPSVRAEILGCYMQVEQNK